MAGSVSNRAVSLRIVTEKMHGGSFIVMKGLYRVLCPWELVIAHLTGRAAQTKWQWIDE